jgi:hypothetical protein
VTSGLVTASWADADLSGGERSVQVRVFSKSEVVERLKRAGVLDEPTGLVRLPKADGVRITLSSGGLVEFRCDGSVERRETPSRRTYFDAEGRPFAWYEGQHLRFTAAPAASEVGNTISVDPNGRYLVTTEGPSPDKRTRIYSTQQLASSLGATPLALIRQ